MMLQRPQEFQRVAREWAVIYAGAPADDSSQAGTAETPFTVEDDSLAQ
jgi:ubiquitin-conjugating enzyme (huntingtin interacting protein 2)